MNCPRCGRDNPSGARFCNACGAPVAETREERRLVSILFADVVASTELAGRLDPEALRGLLARFYDLAREMVSGHGGTLEKFIGDAAMAVFGLPQAHDNDAERAVRSALALREAVAREPALAGVRIRCGVNTGEVVGAVGASGDFLVTGEAVHLGARLQQHAEPGSVLVGERTARATEDAIRYEGPLRLSVKGKDEALLAWRALEAREFGLRPPRAKTPLFGRDDDLALLRVLARRAFAERRVHLITVVAPAGVGKSRLVNEFLAALEREARRPSAGPGPGAPRVARTLCQPYGTALAYGAMRGVLRAFAGTDLAQLDRALHEAALDANQQTAIRVAAGLGEEPPGGLPRDVVAQAWRSFLVAAAGSRPLVIFCDDLHWASDSLLALIEEAVRLPLEVPLVLLFATRPDLFDRHPVWPATKRDGTTLQLRALPAAEVERLVAELGGSALPSHTRARIVSRAEGNPFFVEEMVRAALAKKEAGGPGGALPPGRPSVEQDVEAALPDSVQAAILTRLDQLPGIERRVVQAAAVVGRAFGLEHLRAVDPGVASDAALPALLALAERELLAPLDASRWVFRHVLIRDVAVNTLPRRERAEGHARLAAWLAEQSDGESVELAAAHLEEAWSLREAIGLAPDEALRARAVDALARAADRAFNLYATTAARRHLDRALALAADDATRLPLIERLGDVIARETPSETAMSRYEEALGLWEILGGEPRAGARLHRKIAVLMARWPGMFRVRPTPDDLERHARLALRLDPDLRDRAFAQLALARAELLRQENEAALAIVADARRLAPADAEIGAFADELTSVALLQSGQYERYYVHTRQAAVESAPKSLGDQVETHTSWAYAAQLAWQLDDWALAVGRGLELSERGEVGHSRLHALQYGIYRAAFLDDWDRALELAEILRSEWDRQGEHGANCNAAAAAIAAEINMRRGSTDRAAEFDEKLERAERPASFLLRRLRLGDPHGKLASVREMAFEGAGLMRFSIRDPFSFAEAAESLADEGDAARLEAVLEAPPQNLPPPCAAQLRRAAGRLALLRAEHLAARAELRAALDAYRALGLRWEAATTARHLAPLVPEPERRALREEARAVFTALGDRVSLAQLDAVAVA